MNNEQTFVKQLEAYLNLEFNDFDRRRVILYLEEYRDKLPIIKAEKISYERVTYRGTLSEESGIYDDVFIEPAKIIKMVSDTSGVGIRDIKGNTRVYENVVARHISIYLIRMICRLSLKSIGRMFNKDHSTIIYSISHVGKMLETGQPMFTSLIEKINPQLNQYKKIA